MKPDIRSAVEHLDAPFAVLDLDAALANAADMSRRASGTPIRLASKSIRIRGLISRILEEPGYQGVLGYNLNEAIWLVESSTSNDVLVAYPSAHREALHRLITDDHLRRCITLMVDSVEHLDFIDSVVPASERGRLRICVDIDAALELGKLHIGALRSPIRSVDEVQEFVRAVGTRNGFDLVGLMAYEGQIAGTTDTSPAVAMMKKFSTRELAHRREQLVKAVNTDHRKAGKPAL